MPELLPDPGEIASRYGLPWGIITGLVVYIFFHTVPKWIYLQECERSKALAEGLQSLVADVKTLLALVGKKT